MNSPIDIVVTWVDQSDPKWEESFNHYKNLEAGKDPKRSTDRQAFGIERYRDWESFPFWFRGVEKNCPWVHKVFLVVANKNQVPSWLNIKHPKLRIIYHEEFIPKELLPTFNIMPIEMFYYRIPDLSNNFITCNDDFFFLNPCEEEMFFQNNLCVQRLIPRHTNLYPENNTWNKILNNNVRFLQRHIPEYKVTFKYSHLPEPRQKDFEAKIMKQYYDEIYKSFCMSRFRNPKNYLSWLFIDIMKNTGPHIVVNESRQSGFANVTSSTNFDIYRKAKMACFNDSEMMDDFEVCKYKMLKFLKSMFPNISSFEVRDVTKVPPKPVRFNTKAKLEEDGMGTLDSFLKGWTK